MGLNNLFGQTKHFELDQDGGEYWLSVSDLMAGLMMVFLFISIALMRNALQERDQIKEVAVTYQETQVALFQALNKEFGKNLKNWGAEIDKETLSFNFKSPDVLFDIGEVTLKAEFKLILKDFFPRYLNVLRGFRESIDEVRIEGHTSSIWSRAVSPEEAYFNNMGLSQGRTRSVLSFIYQLPEAREDSEWIKTHAAAVGFSSGRLVKINGIEDSERSRRVLFRVITNAETQIRKILDRTEVNN